LVPDVEDDGVGGFAEGGDGFEGAVGGALVGFLGDAAVFEDVEVDANFGNGGIVDGGTAGADAFLFAGDDAFAPVEEGEFGVEVGDGEVVGFEAVEAFEFGFDFVADHGEVQDLDEVGDVKAGHFDLGLVFFAGGYLLFEAHEVLVVGRFEGGQEGFGFVFGFDAECQVGDVGAATLFDGGLHGADPGLVGVG